MRQRVEDPFFVYHLKNEIKPVLSGHREIVFVCIGTDRSSGDSYGPFVGAKLKQSYLVRTMENVFVYGCLDHPVHAKNLPETMKTIQQTHRDPLVIAVDACLGSSRNVGTVVFERGPIKPGAGVQKDLPPVGHYHISAIVNVGGFLSMQVLQGTRLSLVYKMANKTVDFVTRALAELAREAKKGQAV